MRLFPLRKKFAHSDEELVRLYRETNDTEYVAALYYRYNNLLAALAWKYIRDEQLATDAVFEVFEILCKDLKRLEVRKFSNWLHSLARNHFLKTVQKDRKWRGIHSDLKESHEPFMESEDDLDQYIRKEEILSLMESEMEHLNEAQRTCLRLFYLEDLDYKGVADKTGFELKRVKSHIQNGKRNLKIAMEKHQAE